MIWRTGTRKNYRIWFLPISGISSCGISQGQIISVNWLLCYRSFFKNKFISIISKKKLTFCSRAISSIILKFNAVFGFLISFFVFPISLKKVKPPKLCSTSGVDFDKIKNNLMNKFKCPTVLWDEVVVLPIDLARPGIPGGVTDWEPQVLPVLRHQLLHQTRLSRTWMDIFYVLNYKNYWLKIKIQTRTRKK